ncbi:SMP-30/gluconolactonase/LRE family protein [Ramlibacter sp. AW1]|uniref:SMP-30/gluconolactonase/LRE family protein n=1 Tax=Ramlibacter aurantiacus TaxID=2801330 RepID=A0A937D0D1_9BURK|nr:SMP-30/gluconolactonase/LRE family protein [Ramlibacter aurantiacus]MBL0419299.1 SMP-30/gluconolactonase/LRE family protein [Ramlibacter aurantiacus]
MYAPPPQIDAELHARLPDALRKRSRCAWGDVNNGGRETPCFLEGPVFDREGRLYVTDIPYGRIFRIDARGEFELVCEYDGEPNGLKFHPDGRLFVADYKNGVMALDVQAGRMEEVIGRRHTETFKGVNDLHFADNGDLYFTDQGQTGMHDPTGRVYRYTTAGQLQLLLDKVPSPNGICLNGAQTHLLLAVTRGNCIWRAPLMPDGTLSKVGVFIQMSGGTGPDGMAVDEQDGLAVAHPGMGGAWIFDRRGVPALFVRTPAGEFPTNLAYGGSDRRELFIVESHSGSILRARVPVAGRALRP